MKNALSIVFLLLTFSLSAQINDSIYKQERTVKVNDNYYREDQFYLGVTHAVFVEKPEGFKQNSISTGIQLGFLRDIPLNENRNIGIAAGAGLSFLNMRSNLLPKILSNDDYQLNSSYDSNALNIYNLDVPIEFRWRSSNKFSHKFWRVYTGVKYSYLLNAKNYYNEMTLSNDENLNKHQLGAYIAAGYNTWNFQIYYGFHSLYKNDILNNNSKFKYLNVGLMFYIL